MQFLGNTLSSKIIDNFDALVQLPPKITLLHIPTRQFSLDYSENCIPKIALYVSMVISLLTYDDSGNL